MLDAVGARAQREHARRRIGISSVPPISASSRRVSARRSRFEAGEPARDAQEARPPERLRVGKIRQRREMLLAELRSARRRVVGQLVLELFGEVADRVVDHGAAVARAGRRVDRVERLAAENVPGVDRVGIAQPSLDLGDRERLRPRVARRLRLGPRDRLGALRRLVERRAPARDSARRAPAPPSIASRPRPRRAAA